MSKKLKALDKTNGTMRRPKDLYRKDTRLWQYEDYESTGLYYPGTGKLYCSPGKKLKNIYPLIYDPSNLIKAQYNAKKGKGRRTEIMRFDKHICDNLQALHDALKDGTYQPGGYKTKVITDPKERVISIAPFFPDRIVHHCIVNVLGQHWTHLFCDNTYACIKGRGTHKCMTDVHKALMADKKGTKYCLKIDVRKYFDNVDHQALKEIVRYTIADEDCLELLDKIIDSNGKDNGLPIGNFTSQYLANLYLAYFDHWAKEALGLKYYYRYMDDIVVLHSSKERLHEVLDDFALYLGSRLKLEIKDNWQIFPVDARGIDYCGFKQNHYGILLRKSILNRFYRKYNKMHAKGDVNIKDINDMMHLFPSEYGWIGRCSEMHSKYIFNQVIDNGNNTSIERGLDKPHRSSYV